MNYLNAARQFIEKYFPTSTFALVAGSVVRGEATETSDLDIFILVPDLNEAYRESYFEFGWPIEAFVHNFESYEVFFHRDVSRRRPSLPMMCSEGKVIVDKDNLFEIIQSLAKELLSNGPSPFTNEEYLNQRYMITDLLDDLIGARKYDEQIFIVNELTERICNFVLVNRGQWMGRGKWIPRLIRKMDEELYNNLINSLEYFYKYNDKEKLIDLVMQELNRYGGRLFEGYSLGKTR